MEQGARKGPLACMGLRDYQSQITEDIYAQWGCGAQNVMAVLPTGGGKTVVFAGILRDHDGHSVAIAHRSELVGQMSLALARESVPHDIVGPVTLVRQCVRTHQRELGRTWYRQGARCSVASVDTVAARGGLGSKVSLWVIDEGHHVLRDNKWGKAVAGLNGARGLAVTATPCRADGKGLGRHADGLMDALVIGPTGRELIGRGYLSRYRIYAPSNDVDLSQVGRSSTGDFVPGQLRTAVHESKTLVGNVVGHYLRLASGKRGITFATDVQSAVEMAAEYRDAGVRAEVVSAKTPAVLREDIMCRLAAGDVTQVVNVDLFGEGFDLPAIEIISLARPTDSYSLFSQQFGRGLRIMDGKDCAIIVDHVGNVERFMKGNWGMPDQPTYLMTLDRRERKSNGKKEGPPMRVCSSCSGVWEGYERTCPYCSHVGEPPRRTAPEFVEGDLTELDVEAMETLYAAIERVDGPPRLPYGASPVVVASVRKNHAKRQGAQAELRDAIAQWAGYQRAAGIDDSESYRRFWHAFGTDVLTAQALNAKDAVQLTEKIHETF